MYLLIDAYHSKCVFPLYVVLLLDGLMFPFFVATLISVDRVLGATVRPGRQPQQQQRQSQSGRSTVESVGVISYVVASAVVHARSALVPSSQPWIVAVQAVFVTWCLILFVLVLGRCWDLRRTARRADAVRSLLASYVRLKRHLANGSENPATSGRHLGTATAAARRHLRLLRRQMEVLSQDGGFPMTSRRRNETTADPPTSSSSSSVTDVALSTDSLCAILSRREVGERPMSVRLSDCTAVDGVDLEHGAASGDVLRASDSDPEARDVHGGQDANADVVRQSPTDCSQQTFVFVDNHATAAAGHQLLADVAAFGCGRTTASDAASGFSRPQRGLRRLRRAFGTRRRQLYEYLRSEAAEWLGMSGQLRLMSEHPPPRSSKSRLARSRSRASNISAGQRSISYNLAQSPSELCEPKVGDDVEDQTSRMVTSSSRLSESTYTELSLLSVPALTGTGSCPTDDGREISRDEKDRHETGYSADTEPETSRHRGGRRYWWSRDRVQHVSPSCSELSDDSASGRRRIELPALTTRCMRMRRHIPDGALLRRSLWAAVAVASSTLSVCVLQIYAALGIYGVLSNQRVVESPWAWLVFHTLNRCVIVIVRHFLRRQFDPSPSSFDPVFNAATFVILPVLKRAYCIKVVS